MLRVIAAQWRTAPGNLWRNQDCFYKISPKFKGFAAKFAHEGNDCAWRNLWQSPYIYILHMVFPLYIYNLYMKVPQMAGDCLTFDHGDRVAMPRWLINTGHWCLPEKMGMTNRTRVQPWKPRWATHKYLVGGLEHLDYFSIYWECHHPNWRTPSFFRGVV